MTVIDGALIKRRREELRLTVREVAQLMNYANHYSYYRIERGLSKGSQLQLQLLADALGFTWDELLGQNPNEPHDNEPIE
jgi:transcriptional regulator with XRE-family HTH domain